MLNVQKRYSEQRTTIRMRTWFMIVVSIGVSDRIEELAVFATAPMGYHSFLAFKTNLIYGMYDDILEKFSESEKKHNSKDKSCQK